MEMHAESLGMESHHTTILQLANGNPPKGESELNQLSVGIDSVVDFWRDSYLREYIPAGGSKMKFITGKAGSGKTHILNLFESMAVHEQYVTVSFSAKDVWLHDFKEVYLEILRQCDLDEIIRLCSIKIVEALGFDYDQVPAGLTFIDYLSQEGMADALTRREIRLQLKMMFMDNKSLDNNFALASSLLCGGLLGHPFLEPQSKQTLMDWMFGEKSVKVAALRPLGLAPTKLTKFNARHMLRSLAELIRLAGYRGLLVCIDNMEVLVDRSSLNPMHYTKMKRDDTYESLRQLIDDIDTFRNIMILVAFDRALLDNENTGLKSYQALWMRIQNEIVSQRINRFSDIVDMDAISYQFYDPHVLVEMSRRLAQLVNSMDVHAEPISESKAIELLKQAQLGGVSLPRLVNQATLLEQKGGLHVQ